MTKRSNSVTRRTLLGSLMAGGAIAASPAFGARAWVSAPAGVRLSDGALAIDIDAQLQARLSHGDRIISSTSPCAALLTADRGVIDRFLLLDHDEDRVDGEHGKGRRHKLRATAGGDVELDLRITFLDRYPGLALCEARFRNTGSAPIPVTGWRLATHELLSDPRGAWTFSGSSHPDRRDWARPVTPGYDERNFMGMNASDYGGGTPVSVVWGPDVGVAVGHVEKEPRLVSMPVTALPGATRLGIAGDAEGALAPGESLALPVAMVMAHRGDFFRPLDAYRRIMADRGLAAPAIPDSSYGPIWCAWGYERNFTTAQIYGTLPKARDMGFEWAVLDDGWQTSEGDWKVDRTKFPRGGADMKAFADRIKADGMLPRLWLAPLAVDPGTDLLRDHPDMLLLGKDGEKQDVTWWDSYTLCPAYQPTIDYHRALVRRIIGEWGFEGIKLDGQHLNGVAPCYNPAHNHARPEESFEKLQDFWKALYDEAMAINPEAVIEICPCGDSFAFHNIPAMNNTPASDPLTSWQVRSKGKTFKALMGPSAPYAGDHVELSDGGNDFASTYGVGAIPSTKFTWPADTRHPNDKLPPGGYVLTRAKEAVWRKWIDLYRENMLSKGAYLGGLYDLAFDRPEAHAIEKDGALHYAFYAERWDGPIDLRGLGSGRYALTDGFSGESLGEASGGRATIDASFEKFLLVQATPVAGGVA